MRRKHHNAQLRGRMSESQQQLRAAVDAKVKIYTREELEAFARARGWGVAGQEKNDGPEPPETSDSDAR